MSNAILIKYFKTEFGELILGSFDNKLCLCDWRYRKQRNAIDTRITKSLNGNYELGNSEIIEKTKIQLTEYFNRKRTEFDIPLLILGTDFQTQVWQALIKIPYGKTFSYLELSNKLNKPKAIRAVATANGANAISILIPCHRIIGKSGDLVGYAGGFSSKKKLLQLEDAIDQNQLNLFS